MSAVDLGIQQAGAVEGAAVGKDRFPSTANGRSWCQYSVWQAFHARNFAKTGIPQ
ncbi:hypothetical protein [Rhizobium sp. AB2/73]|uniref:hypothetical protein n=1 Tax=Rhizobium sp. AB2/73 TaxID=2795216 RepID=UPI001C788E4F|nr:hypothetical protein [Rhizobium sp. AB2/73]QYA15589.1 hypothetical protein J5284_21570 [Rhizobium sp. AB2/73]